MAPTAPLAFYQPLIAELDVLSKGKPVRLEVPPTQHHWESAYIAPDLQPGPRMGTTT